MAGMGEPAHKLDNVLDAIDLLGTDGGIWYKNDAGARRNRPVLDAN